MNGCLSAFVALFNDIANEKLNAVYCVCSFEYFSKNGKNCIFIFDCKRLATTFASITLTAYTAFTLTRARHCQSAASPAIVTFVLRLYAMRANSSKYLFFIYLVIYLGDNVTLNPTGTYTHSLLHSYTATHTHSHISLARRDIHNATMHLRTKWMLRVMREETWTMNVRRSDFVWKNICFEMVFEFRIATVSWFLIDSDCDYETNRWTCESHRIKSIISFLSLTRSRPFVGR